MITWVLTVAGIVGMIVVCVYISKEKRPFLRAGASSICGLGMLGAINVFSAFTGVSIAVNYATSLISVVFSIPGVVLLLFLRVIFVF